MCITWTCFVFSCYTLCFTVKLKESSDFTVIKNLLLLMIALYKSALFDTLLVWIRKTAKAVNKQHYFHKVIQWACLILNKHSKHHCLEGWSSSLQKQIVQNEIGGFCSLQKNDPSVFFFKFLWIEKSLRGQKFTSDSMQPCTYRRGDQRKIINLLPNSLCFSKQGSVIFGTNGFMWVS